MTTSATDSIRKEITLKAPRSRVWRAISDSAEFGQWFRVRLEGPFRVGEVTRGQITHPGCEHMVLEARVERIEPETCLAFRWHPYDVEPGLDPWSQPTTLVEFRLEDAGEGTRLTVTESGFDGIAEELRHDSFTRNEGGWTAQMGNIEQHVDG